MYEIVKFLLKLLLKGTVQLRDTAKVYVWLLQKHLYFLPHTHKPHKKTRMELLITRNTPWSLWELMTLAGPGSGLFGDESAGARAHDSQCSKPIDSLDGLVNNHSHGSLQLYLETSSCCWDARGSEMTRRLGKTLEGHAMLSSVVCICWIPFRQRMTSPPF